MIILTFLLLKQKRINEEEDDSGMRIETSSQRDFVERHGITTNEQFDGLQSYLRLSFTKEANLNKFWYDQTRCILIYQLLQSIFYQY